MSFHTQPVHAAAGINQQMNYQGRLLDSTGAIVPDGTYNMEFKIYQDGTGCVSSGTSPCGGTLKWTETRTGANQVTVRNGYFSVQLGSVTAFGTSVDWNQDTLWLSVNIGGTSGTPTWDGEMTPFHRLASTPYAMNAGKLGGLNASQFVQLAPSAVQVDSGTLSSIFLNKTGASGNILELQNNGSDVFTVGNAGALTIKSATATSPVMTINRSSDGTAGLEVRVSGVGGADPGNNLFMGVNAGASVTPIAGATAQGVRNIGLGDSALNLLTTGANNIAIGTYTMQSLTSGNYNTGVGEHSLSATTNGVNNNGLGALTLSANTTGSYNSAVGASALIANTTGSGNIAVGDSALSGTTTGSDNSAFGFNAGMGNTLGSGVTLLGAFSNVSNNNLFNATAIGYAATVNQSNALTLGGTGGNAVSVGIGTATPGAFLQISTASTTNSRFRITDTVGTAFDEFAISATGAATFQDRTNAQNTFTILNSGGTHMFDVDTADNFVDIGYVASGSGASARLGFGDMGCADTVSPTSAACVWVGEQPTGDTDILQLHGTSGIEMSYGSINTGSPALQIDSSGNVNIGATSNTLYVGSSGRIAIGSGTPDATAVLSVATSTTGGGIILAGAASTPVSYKITTGGTTTSIFAYANAGSDWATGTGAGDTVVGSSNNGLALVSGNSTRIRILNTGAIQLNGVGSASGTSNSIVCLNSSNQIVKGTTTTCNPSSIRFKENVQNMLAAEGLDALEKLRPVSFEYKSDPNHANQYGFIAEEVVNVLPEDVAYDDQGQIYGVNYEMIVPNIVKAIQEQQAEIQGIQQGIWNGGIVANDSTFNGAVSFNGGVTFSSTASFGGPVTFSNNVTFASNTAGTATIPAGQRSVTLTFGAPHSITPVVNATPNQFVPAGFRVTNVSTTQFTIELSAPLPSDVVFNWSAIEAK